MNLDGTRPNPGKTRVYLQKSRFTRKIPGRVPTNVCRARRHIALSQGQCATCGAQLLLKYAHRTMCCRYACLKAAAAKRRARHADGSADDAVAMIVFCFKIVAVLGMHFCDPNQLIATKQRNKLAAANKALCYLTCGSFKEDQHTQASLTCVCLSLRLWAICENCLARDCAQEAATRIGRGGC